MRQFDHNSINLIYLQPNISTSIYPMKVTYKKIELRLLTMHNITVLNLFHLDNNI